MSQTSLSTEEVTFEELCSRVYTATLKDDAVIPEPVPLASITSLAVTLYNASDKSVINGRDAQNALNANQCTYHATSGLFTFNMLAADNPIVGTVLMNEKETHWLIIAYSWNSGAKTNRHVVKILVTALDKVW